MLACVTDLSAFRERSPLQRVDARVLMGGLCWLCMPMPMLLCVSRFIDVMHMYFVYDPTFMF